MKSGGQCSVIAVTKPDIQRKRTQIFTAYERLLNAYGPVCFLLRSSSYAGQVASGHVVEDSSEQHDANSHHKRRVKSFAPRDLTL